MPITYQTRPQILLPMCGQDSDQTLLAQTLSLASWLDGDVTPVVAQPNPADVLIWTADGAFLTMPSNLVELSRKGADEAWAKARQIAESLPLERMIGPVESNLAKRAALADLAVLSCESARGMGLLSSAFETLVMEARTPVFVPREPAATLTQTIEVSTMIAWNGSIEGARAVRAAMPFLARSKQVLIATVGDRAETGDTDLGDPRRLEAQLARADVKSEILKLEGSDAPKVLLDAAKSRGVGLLVAGAWGHSRAREFVFGGATRSFLKDASSPSLLMAH
jgi:nucleotide-binding universal stress UspA family protein